ncbi:hypothetical protein [Fischerella thermalis]|nr:hypothetical protein [Fischerella thermalis]
MLWHVKLMRSHLSFFMGIGKINLCTFAIKTEKKIQKAIALYEQ